MSNLFDPTNPTAFDLLSQKEEQQPFTINKDNYQQANTSTNTNTSANGMTRNQKIGYMLAAISDAFAGRDVAGRAMARAQAIRQQAEVDRQRQEALRKQELIASLPEDIQRIYGVYGPEAAFKAQYGTASERKIIKGADGYNYYTDTLERVLPSVEIKPTTDSSTRFSILDNGVQIGTILRSDIKGIREAEDKGYQIANLASPTTRPSGQNKIFDDVLTQHKATNKIIKATSGLAQKYFAEPTSALALGGAVKFVDSLYTNLTALGDFGREGADNQAAQDVEKGISISGEDYTDRIKEVSIATGVTESRVRDLAYLFAAARGQTGRGLSDKDYENALTIVSGGVGAQGKIAVLEDVANRLSEELMMDINYIKKLNPDKQNLIKQINNLPDINTFINPFTQAQPQTGGSDPLGIR